jgi:hypothetical protein
VHVSHSSFAGLEQRLASRPRRFEDFRLVTGAPAASMSSNVCARSVGPIRSLTNRYRANLHATAIIPIILVPVRTPIPIVFAPTARDSFTIPTVAMPSSLSPIADIAAAAVAMITVDFVHQMARTVARTGCWIGRSDGGLRS